MTARWNPIVDASDLRAEAADDALGEIYAGRDEWEPDDVDYWPGEVVWTCIRCETDHRSGSPEMGCPDCGWVMT